MEDLLDSPALVGPSIEIQEKIKFICNNTGKNNLNQKLEELKGYIGTADHSNLNWFINFVLTKRIVS